MDWIYYIIIILIIAIIIISVAPHFKKKSSQNLDDQVVSMENVGTASYKLLAPLRIQACERLLLYVERIQFPVLIKRIYIQGVSRNDFQFSLLQNVEDELEHNLAQRLYVSENSWHLIILAKEEVLQNINAAFADNPEVDSAAMARILVSFENPMVEKAVASIKREFLSFMKY